MDITRIQRIELARILDKEKERTRRRLYINKRHRVRIKHRHKVIVWELNGRSFDDGKIIGKN
jgi:hypothetical protein